MCADMCVCACVCFCRLLKTQSLEWFYSNVRRRFKRFGSAKVLKMLYRQHVGDQGSQAEFTGVKFELFTVYAIVYIV